MNIHEFQAKEILERYGVPVLKRGVARKSPRVITAQGASSAKRRRELDRIPPSCEVAASAHGEMWTPGASEWNVE